MAAVVLEPQESELSAVVGVEDAESAEFNWVFIVVITAFHLGAIAALFNFHWSSLVAFLVLWFFGQNVGVAISYHRQLTHRGFTTPMWLEHFMAVCGTMALQGSPIYWVAVHRMHHKYTDKPGDPHSPRDGKWWSHMGWLLRDTTHSESSMISHYAPDLDRDRFYRWLNIWHWVPLTLMGLALMMTGTALDGWKLGLSWILWGVFLRIAVGFHVTWLVNSANHLWGTRRFKTRDDSTNNWWVALLTGGEGWHNNHHAHPVSASHGMAWWEVDFNYWCIQLLAMVGLAKNVKVMRYNATAGDRTNPI